jgi:hypothetical protein
MPAVNTVRGGSMDSNGVQCDQHAGAVFFDHLEAVTEGVPESFLWNVGESDCSEWADNGSFDSPYFNKPQLVAEQGFVVMSEVMMTVERSRILRLSDSPLDPLPFVRRQKKSYPPHNQLWGNILGINKKNPNCFSL